MRKVLLLRGVNVGGTGRLPMADLRSALAGLGLGDVQSHIQSGNLVFDDPGLPDLAGALARLLADRFALTRALFLYTAPEFARILDACPFADAAAQEGAAVHLYFLAAPSPADVAALRGLAGTERLHLDDRALYLHAPDGIGRSALAQALPRLLKVPHTARNWNTARALRALARC
ncbi:MAG: DUF1697 domain-containing protein [Paracoccaceae bacterium]